MRPWDNYPAYLFDLDGTLLHCTDAVHYFGFCCALELLAGRALTLEGVTAHGNTDLGILRDALDIAGVPESVWRPRMPLALAAMKEYVLQHKSEMDVQAIPGVSSALQHLHRDGALLGVATGNLEVIGKLKLHLADLSHDFRFGSFSDDLDSREAVFARALENLPAGIAPEQVCFVGDTPRDIEAARHCGSPVIAVATGTYNLATLQSYKPDYCVQSLSDLPQLRY